MGKRPLPAGAPSHVHCEHLPAWAAPPGWEVPQQAGPQCVFVGGLWWVWGGEQRDVGCLQTAPFVSVDWGRQAAPELLFVVLSAWCWHAVWSVSGR